MKTGIVLSSSFAVIALAAFETVPSAQAWTSPSSSSQSSRREMLQQTIRAAQLFTTANVIATTTTPAIANAASSSLPSPSELSKLQVGHARVRYLLSNWEDITTVCAKGVMSDVERKQVIRTEGGGGGFCERTPLNVQGYLGYKSTTDPLFKADKLMLRAAPLVDVDDFETYLDIVEQYREKADQGAMMAYTSSWGEANPGGGKEVIDEYLEKTKVEVEQTELLLRDVLKFLNLEVLPPSNKVTKIVA